MTGPAGNGAVAEAPSPGRGGHELVLHDINHRFGALVAAEQVNLRLAPGELVAFLGPSGCGKTTLLRIIAGFLRQTDGDVLVDGRSISDQPANKRNIGIVFQNYALFPHMTVAENVAYGLRAQRAPRERVARVVKEMLALVQMEHFRDRFPRQLSGGQQQRIALARCLATGPRILLLDEPFGALDKNLRLDMQIEIKRLQRQAGITTVLVTHDQEEALSMADRIAVLQNGRVEQFASPTEVYDSPASLFVNTFVGTTNLIPATVEGRDGGATMVRLANGHRLSCATDSEHAMGAAVLYSVRPERVAIVAAASAGSFPVTVRAVLPLGASTVYEVVLSDSTPIKIVQNRERARAGIAPGDVIQVAPSAHAESCLFKDQH